MTMEKLDHSEFVKQAMLTANEHTDPYAQARQELDRCQFDSADDKGHYESYFLRANHPDKPLAFWIRYTIYSPKGRKQDTIGELWVIFFDGETRQVTAAKEEMPFSACRFSEQGLDISLADMARLVPGATSGQASSSGNKISWQLRYQCKEAPLKLLPDNLYDKPLPKAKAVTPCPNALFNGVIQVNGDTIHIENWQGSENHNWGSKHTDRYAWAQVAGFDNAPDAFLECGTAKLKIGPFWTPWLTTVVFRHEGRELKINNLLHAARVRASFHYFNWHLDTQIDEVSISCDIYAPRYYFVGLNYYNPPGGSNTCLNSKIAGCRLVLAEKGQAERVYETRHRAAFEILTADADHGIPVVA